MQLVKWYSVLAARRLRFGGHVALVSQAGHCGMEPPAVVSRDVSPPGGTNTFCRQVVSVSNKVKTKV